jgi:ABC-type enterobactin transport system permease subunit
MSIKNDADRNRAAMFWLLWVIGTIGLALSVCCFMLVGVEIETQLVVFFTIEAVLTTAFLVGRWNAEPLEEEDFAERWKIGPWIITFMLIELAFCGLIICAGIWAVVTHHRPPLGAI